MENQTDKSRVTRINIGRVYNLGNYEHVRFDLTVEVPDGESAEKAMLGLEKIITALKPEKTIKSKLELEQEAGRIAAMALMSDAEFTRAHGGYGAQPRAAQIEYARKRLEEEKARSEASIKRSKKARALLDDLGGASEWKDAKLSWEDHDDDY
jgi:hypothetical protein